MDRFKCGVDYAEHAVDMGRGKKGMSAEEKEEFLDDVARNVLLMGCNVSSDCAPLTIYPNCFLHIGQPS